MALTTAVWAAPNGRRVIGDEGWRPPPVRDSFEPLQHITIREGGAGRFWHTGQANVDQVHHF
jgi:hypothetical protein